MIKKLYINLLNSLNGLKIVTKENSFILELILGFFLAPYIIFSNIDYNQKVLLFILYCLLLAFETMNTSIEKLCNKLTTDFDPKIRDIKDLSSAAVFIILIVLIIIFLITLPNNFLS
jgi:diacylglycerol kinase (ATP)